MVLGKRGQVYWIVHQNKVISCAASRMISVEDAEVILMERDDDIESVYSKTVSKDSLPPSSSHSTSLPLNQTGKEPNSSKDTAETSKNTVSTSDDEPEIIVKQKGSVENIDEDAMSRNPVNSTA